jgi:hypothetical protein
MCCQAPISHLRTRSRRGFSTFRPLTPDRGRRALFALRCVLVVFSHNPHFLLLAITLILDARFRCKIHCLDPYTLSELFGLLPCFKLPPNYFPERVVFRSTNHLKRHILPLFLKLVNIPRLSLNPNLFDRLTLDAPYNAVIPLGM